MAHVAAVPQAAETVVGVRRARCKQCRTHTDTHTAQHNFAPKKPIIIIKSCQRFVSSPPSSPSPSLEKTPQCHTLQQPSRQHAGFARNLILKVCWVLAHLIDRTNDEAQLWGAGKCEGSMEIEVWGLAVWARDLLRIWRDADAPPTDHCEL